MTWVSGLRQYQPYALAVLAVVAAANFMPSPDRTEETSPVNAAVTETTSAPTTSTTRASAVTREPIPTGSAAPPSSAVGPAPEPQASNPTSAAVERDASTAPPQLTIVESGYASSEVTVGDPEVPDDGMPVAAGATGPSKVSFVRLAGSATELVLALVAEEDAHRLADLAEVAACPVTEDWDSVRGQPMSAAPAYECSDAVVARRVDATTFAFDLSPFPSPGSGHGFALVPSGEATGFYVTFSIYAVEES